MRHASTIYKYGYVENTTLEAYANQKKLSRGYFAKVGLNGMERGEGGAGQELGESCAAPKAAERRLCYVVRELLFKLRDRQIRRTISSSRN
eukprot:6212547-Pleurochrysis_carterae.AAC.4